MNTVTAESQLSWFFHHSAAAMGMQSSFESIRNAILTGGASRSSMVDSWTDKRVEATHKHRQILTRLNAVHPRRHVDILHVAYQSRAWSDEMQTAFGRAVGVTSHTTAAHRYYEEDAATTPPDGFWAWLESVVLRNEQDRINEIRLEATDLLRAAIQAYAKAILT